MLHLRVTAAPACQTALSICAASALNRRSSTSLGSCFSGIYFWIQV